MPKPTSAVTKSVALVTTKMGLPRRALYVVKPADVPIWPRYSHFDTPLLVPSRHCLYTWRQIVKIKSAELAHPMRSVISWEAFRKRHTGGVTARDL